MQSKLYLGTIITIISISAIFAFNENKRQGNQRLYTTSSANGCRLANCWTCVNHPNPSPCPSANYYTQKTVGGKCKTIYTGCKSTIN